MNFFSLNFESMGKSKYVFLVVFTTLVFSTSFGRVGDLEATSESRYGKPIVSAGTILDGTTTKRYKKGNFIITQAYLNGRCIRAQYSKLYAKGTPHTIQTDELAAMLKGEGESGKWEIKHITTGSGFIKIKKRIFVCSNGKVAELLPSDMILRVDSPAVKKHLADLAKKRESNRKNNIPKF